MEKRGTEDENGQSVLVNAAGMAEPSLARDEAQLYVRPWLYLHGAAVLSWYY